MSVQVAKQQTPPARSFHPVVETVSGFSGTVTVTSVTDSTAMRVIGLDWISNATRGASLGGFYCASEYEPGFVASILRADAEPPEAQFNNVVDMLNWLNRD